MNSSNTSNVDPWHAYVAIQAEGPVANVDRWRSYLGNGATREEMDQWTAHLTHVWSAVVNHIDQEPVRLAVRQLVETLLQNNLLDQSHAAAPEQSAEEDDQAEVSEDDPLINYRRWADLSSESDTEVSWVVIGGVGRTPPSSGQSSQINVPT